MRILLIALLLASWAAFAQQSVRPYVKRDGTLVMPYNRTQPNGYKFDNYSYKGNQNPFTGKVGKKK